MNMENAIILLMTAVMVAMLVLIFVYNRFDRQRFHLERLFGRNKAKMDEWVRACEALKPGCGKAYFAAKKLPEQTEQLRAIAQSVTENSGEKLDLQEQLLDFCYHFTMMAGEYDRMLESPLTGKIAQWMRFRRVGGLDFYPDVTAGDK